MGEKMPDKDDPQYKEQYERDVDAGRRFAKWSKLDKFAAKVQEFANKHTKAFLIIEVGANLLFAVGTFVGIRLFEMNVPMFAYALENFVTLVALLIAVRRLKWNTP